MRRACIILCGGRSTRMGRDKASLPFGQTTVLEHIVAEIGGTADAGCIVVAADQQSLPPLPHFVTVVRDRRPDRGPLEGLAAGLEDLQGQADAVFVASCDAPHIVAPLVHRFFALLGKHDAVVLRLAGIPQPMPAAYRVSVLETVKGLLEENSLSLRRLLNAIDTRYLDAEDVRPADPQLASFFNMNTPADYETVRQRAWVAPGDLPTSGPISPAAAKPSLESPVVEHHQKQALGRTSPMSIEQKLADIGLTLPEVPKPVAAYVPSVRSGNLVFVSGQLPFTGKSLLATGPVPSHTPVDQAQSAAQQCVLNGLAALKAELGGDLSRLKRVVRIGVFVQSQDGFTEQAAVANGASELLQELLGDAGRHARASVGVNALPLNASVEVEFTFEVE